MGKILKKFVIFLLTMVLTVGLVTGCGTKTGTKNPDKIKIGVTLYDQYDTFISQLMECLTDLVEENVELVVYNASTSQQTQNDQVKKMIEDGCSVICVNLVDRTDPTAVIDAARKADVPIIFFNRELVEGDMGRWNRLFYVGADAIESGVMEGELAADAIKADATIDRNGDGVIQFVVLEGEAGHQDAIVRTEYSVDTLIKAGVEVDKLGYAIANWNRAQAQTKMAQLIEQNGSSIELVMSNNDDMALGAIDAYEAAGFAEDLRPVFFGIDGTDVGLEAVADGRLRGTVYNDKEGQAGAIYRLAVTLAKGGSISDLSDEYKVEDDKYIKLPYAKITADNIGEYIKRTGSGNEKKEEVKEQEEKGFASIDYPMFKQIGVECTKYYEGDLTDENYFGDDKDHRLLYYAKDRFLLVTKPYKDDYPKLDEFLAGRVPELSDLESGGVIESLGDIDVVKEYEELVSSGFGFIGPWYDMQSDSVTFVNDRILSFVTYYENYGGGAHGYHYKAGTTVDIKTGETYELKDILNISDEQLRAIIRDRIKIEYSDDYKDFWDLDTSLANYYIDADAIEEPLEQGKYVTPYNWTMNPDGIHFYFNPYDLAAYAFGVIEATVPYDLLGDFPGKAYVEDSENNGYIVESPLFPNDSKWDSDDPMLLLYYVPGEDGLAKGLYLSAGSNKASFNETFMMDDEQSIKTKKIITKDGREFVYVTSESFGYYYDFFAFEIVDGVPKTVGRTVFSKMNLEASDYEDAVFSEGASIDAEHLCFGEINTIIGDFVLVGQYRVGDDGMPEFAGEYKYVTECSDHITLKKELKVEVVDEEGNTISEETLMDGTHIMPWRTAGDKFVDCHLDDGRIVRISYSRSSDEPDIDGEYLMDIFDGETYIG